jgi:putative selenium metabolism protein SsnA
MNKCLTNAILVQLDPAKVELGSLRIVGENIAEIGQAVTPQDGDEVIDCQGCVVMPGLVNGHTHLYSALAAGMPAPPKTPKNFHEILKYVWWRLDRAHDEASVEASGVVGALAALRCGTTTLIDHHASPHFIDGSLTALEAGIATVGCRAVTCYEVTDRNAPDEAARGIAENVRYIEACRAAGNPRFAGMVGAHASFTLSEGSLAQCADACRQTKTGLHIHVAEDPIDAKLTSERFDCGLMDRLERHGILELPQSIIGHATHLSESELARLNECGETISIAHNPNSNMNNGVGYTPIANLAKPPLLGTDGIGADLWREARTALFKSHDANRAIPFDGPLKMLAASAKLASSYLGCRLGVLDGGAAADLVVSRYQPATPLTAENLAGHVIYAMGPEFIRDVMIGGEWCLRNGEVTSCDETEVRRSTCEVTHRLYDRLAQIGADD